jgi:hypothetical protein
MNGFAHASRPRESVAGFGVSSGGVSRLHGKGSNCDRGLSSVRSHHVNFCGFNNLQDVPGGESGVRSRGPVLFNGHYGFFCRIKAFEDCEVLGTRRVPLAVRCRSNSPSNQERTVHHDSKVSISPLGDAQSKCIFGAIWREDRVVLR